MIKSTNSLQQHIALIRQMEATYGGEIETYAASLYDPSKPAFFRTVLKRRDFNVNASLISQIRSDVKARVLMHDKDKYDIARYTESIAADDPHRVERYEGAEARYRAHDLGRDHHAACWVSRGVTLHCCSFIEHLLDHAAVNAAHNQAPFDIEMLMRAGAFYDKRVETEQGLVSDLELYFNMDSFVMKHLVAKTVDQYRELVTHFLPVLEECNKAYGG